jgi:shikimate kinase
MFKNYSSITLIGLPGSGKSYIGKLLAKKMKYRFIDTDSEISKQEKMSIKDIFLTYGEEYFRRKEEELIKKLALKQRIVISTGGGMIENPVIMKYLKYNSKIVHLYREMDDSLFDGRRPKLKTIEDYLSLKDKRMHLYRKYEDLYVKNDKDSDLIVERIIKKL